MFQSEESVHVRFFYLKGLQLVFYDCDEEESMFKKAIK